MQCPQWDSILGPFALYATALPTELKEISTNPVGIGGYEPTTFPIILGSERSHYIFNRFHMLNKLILINVSVSVPINSVRHQQ